MDNPEKIVIIVAGGKGLRMGAAIPKQFMLLGGKPILCHTMDAFTSAYPDIKQIVVLPEDYLSTARELLFLHGCLSDQVKLVCGGRTRFSSVKNGLACTPENSVIFVHDAVRCLVSSSLIKTCYNTALEKGSAVPCIPATDSIRLTEENGVSHVVDRSRVRLVQTPQTFQGGLLKAAYEQPYLSSFTDDASVVQSAGYPIELVAGDPHNIKITRPFDMKIAALLLDRL